jgi:hypothetical protein
MLDIPRDVKDTKQQTQDAGKTLIRGKMLPLDEFASKWL